MAHIPPTKTELPLSLCGFCTHSPKVELHAHLHGSIRPATLRDLCLSHGVSPPRSPRRERPRRSLRECFEIFSVIHSAVITRDDLRRITREALEDFAAEGVCYLELRSTPRRMLVSPRGVGVAEERCSLKDYIRTVTSVMSDFEREEMDRYCRASEAQGGIRLPLIPRYIVSVDRSKGPEEAMAGTTAAVEIFSNERGQDDGSKDWRCCGNYVLGMDLSGNPYNGNFKDFLPAFRLARDAGLKIVIHCGEIPCVDASACEEAERIVAFRPDRLGHALFLPPTVVAALNSDPIPVECCPTSNVLTIELSASCRDGDVAEGLRRHPQLGRWLASGYPFSVSTDDPGVFGTNSSRELMLIGTAHDVDRKEIAKIVLRSVDHAFEGPEFKKMLRDRISAEISNLLQK
mmetsp:Transcript_4154/g.8665  ORF Transcript_4154/g.8665 Transcript_4154/m.8665 type:complete len:403 (-) Transcript_4154:112-1320(-)